MSYSNCPHCGASNRNEDAACYTCNKPLGASSPSIGSASSEIADVLPSHQGEVSLVAGFLAIALSMLFGGLIGFGFSMLEFELPFFLEELILGTLCATATAFCLGKFKEMPEGLLFKRLYPAAAYGALVGCCLYGIWWTFDPSAGLVWVGVIVGFCSGLPIGVSFGLAGGESRPLGLLEFGNVIISLGLGLILGLFIAFDDGDFYYVPGLAGLLGLIPTMFGGRINLWEIIQHFED
jgi:hypothetical protein